MGGPERVQAIVVGAGVVGLAVARALALRGTEVVVLEAEPTFGRHASSRNSEVIHAGLYYPPGSLKARLCIEGKARLRRYCQERGVAHRRVGKIVVAVTEQERRTLTRLRANANACGLRDLVELGPTELASYEPELRAAAGLLSPSTGIVDSHALMRALASDAVAAGAGIAYATAFESASPLTHGFRVTSSDMVVDCDLLINAAGLGAQRVATATRGVPPATIPPRVLVKGTYFTLAAPSPFSHLIYPVPDTASLGVHATLDLGGCTRFGPDQQSVDDVDYAVDPSRAEATYAAVRRYWPSLPEGALRPGYAGIRSRVRGVGPIPDFVVSGPPHHGLPGLLHLYGIDSPGLTASLALADHVLACLDGAS
jgi:L-2-hydroxyglutarate oxidase LhgO